MAKHYIALLRKDPGSSYGVDFPDFPGCISAGESAEEAQHNAAEALALHIEGLLQDGEAIPEPSDLEAILADPDNHGGVALYVPVPASIEPKVKISVDFPSSLLERIDRLTKARKYPGRRSGFLIEAARVQLEKEERA